MSDIPCGSRAVVPITFGGVKYLATKFDLARLIELERWMRRAPFDLLKQVIAESNGELNPAMVREMLANAWDKSQAMLLFTYEGRRFWMMSIEGIARAIWLLLRPEHPKLTFDEVVSLVPPDRVDECTNLIADMMGYPNANPTEPATTPETQTSESPST